MKNIELTVATRGIERLTLTLSAEKDDGAKVFKSVDLSGNATIAAWWGAAKVVEALNEMEKA